MKSLKNLKELVALLRAKAAAASKEPTATGKVGYTAAYAVYVHENLTCNHPKGGQAKYLEQPFREMRAGMVADCARLITRGKTPSQALLLVLLGLQAASQKLVPVDTGNLRASAWTKIEPGR